MFCQVLWIKFPINLIIRSKTCSARARQFSGADPQHRPPPVRPRRQQPPEESSTAKKYRKILQNQVLVGLKPHVLFAVRICGASTNLRCAHLQPLTPLPASSLVDQPLQPHPQPQGVAAVPPAREFLVRCPQTASPPPHAARSPTLHSSNYYLPASDALFRRPPPRPALWAAPNRSTPPRASTAPRADHRSRLPRPRRRSVQPVLDARRHKRPEPAP